MIEISNDTLTVTLSEKGAELQSIRSNGLEYMWQADQKYWGKHAPVLFPIVGELKDGEYVFNNSKYKLSRHGFARDKVFEAEQMSSPAAMFRLQNDAESLLVYPFQFIFQVDYTVEGNKLFCTYHVKNNGTEAMYFSVGGHPAFNVPLKNDLLYTDYVLEFDNDDVLQRYLLRDGLATDATENIQLHDKTLALQPELFYQDAIVLKHTQSKQITLKTGKDPHGLKFNFEGFPYFGIWAAKDAPFICLEPWCGIADNIHHDKEFTRKEGINELRVGENWQRTWSVELF